MKNHLVLVFRRGLRPLIIVLVMLWVLSPISASVLARLDSVAGRQVAAGSTASDSFYSTAAQDYPYPYPPPSDLPVLSGIFPDQVTAKIKSGEEYRQKVEVRNTGSSDLRLSYTVKPGKVVGGLGEFGLHSGVQVPNHSSLNPTNKITIEAWIYPFTWDDGWMHNGRIVQKGATNNQYRLTMEWDDLLFEVVPMGQLRIENWYPPLNTWTHLAAVYNGEKMIIYVNGVKTAERPATGKIATTTDTLFLGNENAELKDSFIGYMDEVRIWAQERYPSEIKRDMGMYLRGDEGGLRAYWRFDTPGQAQVLDSSEYGNHGQPIAPARQVTGASPCTWAMWKLGDGLLRPGELQEIEMVIFPGWLPTGGYASDLMLNSNDPARTSVRVPIALQLNTAYNSVFLPAVRTK